MPRPGESHAPRPRRRRPIGRTLLATMSVLVGTVGAVPTSATAFDDPVTPVPLDSDARVLGGDVTGMPPNFGQGLGQAIEVADVNGDGADDLLVMEGDFEVDGVLSVYLGSPSVAFTDTALRVTSDLALQPGVTAPGPEVTVTGGGLGGDFAVADFDGTGTTEIAAISTGRVVVFDLPLAFGSYELGANLTPTQTIDGPGFPSALTVGNLDIDASTDDLVIGYSSPGQVDIHFGGAIALTANANVEITGPGSSSFGSALATGPVIGVGGADDLIIGAEFEDVGSGFTGRVYGFDQPGLGPGALTWTTDADFQATTDEGNGVDPELFGAALAIGDVVGGPGLDLVIGTPGVDDQNGAVYAIPGPLTPGTSVLSPTLDRWSPSQIGAEVGQALAIGDINGDGLDDVVAGGTDAVYVWEHDAPIGLPGSGNQALEGWRFDGEIDTGLGRAVAISETGSGFLAIGAPSTQTNVVEITDGAGTVELFDLASGGRTFVVNSTADTSEDVIDGSCDDGGTCTLRAAIQEANFVGAATIEFDLPGPTPFVIDVTQDLPVIQASVQIDGFSQPGASNDAFGNMSNNVELRFDSTRTDDGNPDHGLEFGFGADGSSVRAISINGFPDAAVLVRADDVTITRNRLGARLSDDGTGGNQAGVSISSSADGTTVSLNLIANNLNVGVDVLGPNTTITGNRIGTSRTGIAPRPNGLGINVGNDNVTIQNNQISANDEWGIQIKNGSDFTIDGNLIGLTLDDAGFGVTTLGNGLGGINSVGTEGFFDLEGTISGNTIAYNGTATDPFPVNGPGISIGGVVEEGQTGINVQVVDNTIVGNAGSGVEVGLGTVTIQSNRIGVTNSDLAIGNGFAGIDASATSEDGSLTLTVGSTVIPALGNEVANNAGPGILVGGLGDPIGGQTSLVATVANNTVVSNTGDGLALASGQYTIESNLIGILGDGAPAGNIGSGIATFPDDYTSLDGVIGSLDPAAGNQIAFNQGPGINLDGGFELSSLAVAMVGNSIFDNDELGIDIAPVGVNPNGLVDDLGLPAPNNLLNSPELLSAVSNGPELEVEFVLDVPAGDYRVEFFGDTVCDPSGFGEGLEFLTSVDVSTGGGPGLAFGLVPDVFGPGGTLTATVTQVVGGLPVITSEFSNCLVLDPSDGAEVGSVEVTVDLDTTGPGVTSVPISDIPIEAILTASAASGTEAAPLGAVPLTAVSLSASPLGAVPLTAVDLDSVPLGAVPLGAVPVDYPGGWPALLEGTQFEGQVPQAITLEEALTAAPTGSDLEALPLGAVDLTDTPLGAVPLTAVVLGSTDIGATPLTAVPLSAVDLTAAPLGAVPLTAVPLTAVPLTAVPLGAVPLTAVPLGAVPLTAVEIGGIPLSAVEVDGTPLGAVPLTAVDLETVPLGAVPLTAVDLQGTPLGAVPLTAVSFGGSTGCELLTGFSPDCAELGLDDETTLFELAVALEREGSSLAASPLGAVPLTAVPLSAVVINDESIDTLADLFEGTDLSELPAEVLDALTVADILAALVITADYPWEELDFVDLGIQDFVDDATTVRYRATIQVIGDGQVEVSATLPPEYRYRSGSTELFNNDFEGGTFVDPVIDDVPTGQVLTWFVPATDGINDLEFRVSPGFTLGTSGVDIQAIGANETGSQVINAAPHTIAAPVDPTTTSEDTLQFGYLTTPAETDLYEITTPGAGVTTSVFLNHFSEDTDLVLYRPTTAPPAAGGGQTADAPTTQVVEDDGFTRIDSAEPESLGDALIDDASGDVAESSTGRGIADEEAVDYRSDAATTYSIQVNGYNGATSNEPYVLRVKFNQDRAIPACPATGLVEIDAATTAGLPADLETIIVFDQGRMEAIYGADGATDVLAAAQNLVAFLDSSPDFGSAAILFTDDLTSYSDWDANPCDWQEADAIAKDIRAQLIDYAADNESLRYVTILGDDDVIPFHRQVDATSYANEDSYAGEFADNALFGSLSTRHILTDHPYGDPDPIPWLDRFLYLPEISVGRLLETPSEIELAIQTFIDFNGQLDPAATALVTGYDFLIDGATDTAAALTGNGITTESIINDTWTDDTLEDALLVPNGPDFVSANAHYDYFRALPASENLAAESTYGPATLFQADEVLDELDTNPAFSLEGSWLFTMGCHAGLSVSDVTIGASPDWAQTWAGNGGIFTGNTGFGYGDTATVGLTEELIVGLAQGLDGSLSVGQATVNSLQNYYARAGLYGVYDEKVIQQFTTYGLPMYQVGGTGSAPLDPPEPTVSIDPFTGQPSAPIATGPIAVGETATAKGTVYSVDGQTLEIHYRPIQPMTSIDVTVEGLVARGAIITDWTSQDVAEPDIAFSRPVIDDGDAEPEIENDNSVFPSTFAAVTNFERPSSEPGTRTERRQNLNLIVGQYNAPLDRQRLFDDIEVDVLYVDPESPLADDDTTAVIEQVQASIVGPPTDRTVGFIIDVADSTPAARVVVLYRSDVPGSEWRKAELVSGSPWSGGGAVDDGTSEVEYVVQVARENGLVSVSSSKGTFHQAVDAPAPPVTPELSVDIDGTIPGGTWYTGPVTVTLSGDGGPFAVTVDGASVDASTGSFTINDDGVHQVVVTGSDGVPQTFGVPIDQTSPEIEFGTPELIEFGDDVVIDFECRDAGSGLTSCNSNVPFGTVIDTTLPGTRTVTVTATDVAGNPQTSANLEYTVGPAPEVDLTVDPTAVAPGDTVTATVAVGGTIEPDSIAIDWGDGTSETIADTTATHVYDTPGSFDVVATAVFGPASIPSAPVGVEVTSVVEAEIELAVDPALVAVDDQVTATVSVLSGSLVSSEIDWGDGTVQTFSGTTATHTYTTAGIYAVRVTSTFAGGQTVTDTVDEIVVYDPNGQAIVGAGWFHSPAGSSVDAPAATGYTSFIFGSRYFRSTSTEPFGYLQVTFNAADLKFTATHWDWLVTPGDDTAVAEGTGTIRNRPGEFGFRLEVVEGRYVWGSGWQRPELRLTITDASNGDGVYDSGWVRARGLVRVYTPFFRR